MKSLVLLSLLVATAPVTAAGRGEWTRRLDEADPDYPRYERFLASFRPSHDERRRLNSFSSERFHIFKANLRKYEEQQRRDPGASYGVTMFSDLSESEFESMYVSGRQHWNVSLADRLARGETGVSHAVRSNYSYRRQLSGGTIDWRYHLGGRVSPRPYCVHACRRCPLMLTPTNHSHLRRVSPCRRSPTSRTRARAARAGRLRPSRSLRPTTRSGTARSRSSLPSRSPRVRTRRAARAATAAAPSRPSRWPLR